MTPLRILLIDDSEDDATLVIRELSRAGYTVTAERVDTAEALVTALARQKWDVAIADFTMPRFSGTAALTLLRDYDADLPFIIVSGTIGEDAAVEAMKTGAQDYIMKGNLARLVPAVERELREAAGRLARKGAEARLQHLAYHDALTDLPNRVLLNDRLRQAILGAQRAHEPLALMVLDLDGFKAINDSLGHHAGDRVLQEVASRFRTLMRDVDTVARLGGDEFALVLPATSGEGSVLTARKILHHLNRPLLLEGHPLVVSGSLGIAWYPEHGSDAETLLQRADMAMYVAKRGGFRYAVYTPDRDRRAHRPARITELAKGIERDEFSFDYQPIVSLQTGRVVSVEALARWRHPQQGSLLPSEFIELAEHTGLIVPLSLLLLDKALAEWAGPNSGLPISVAVNLSPRNLRDPKFPDQIADLLRLHSASPSALVLEMTETLVMSDPARAATCLGRLHDMGVRLAIEDVGAGDTSLSDLRQLPVDQLKIDRSLVSGLLTGDDDRIVRSTIDLAHDLGLTVAAEGVESMMVRDRLCELGCDAAQGIFIAEPGPTIEIRRWVAHQNAQRPL